jgi:hypothetical protein
LVVAMGLTYAIVAIALILWRHPHASDPPDPAQVAALLRVDYRRQHNWEDAMPRLQMATRMPRAEAVRFLLQSESYLRTAVARQVMAACQDGSRDPVCQAVLGSDPLESEISERIDKLVSARIRDEASMTSADCEIAQPFPVKVITAMRSRFTAYATLVWELAPGGPYSRLGVEEKYGAPDAEAQGESESVLTYGRSNVAPDYESKLQFHIDSMTSQVRSVWVMVQHRSL